eukprot:scaffold2645_cov378-Prasinococcus_capsulatus_cf.AAC.19
MVSRRRPAVHRPRPASSRLYRLLSLASSRCGSCCRGRPRHQSTTNRPLRPTPSGRSAARSVRLSGPEGPLVLCGHSRADPPPPAPPCARARVTSKADPRARARPRRTARPNNSVRPGGDAPGQWSAAPASAIAGRPSIAAQRSAPASVDLQRSPRVMLNHHTMDAKS